MENSENKPQNTEANNHPKPTEEVQMNIETVTPDTEKEGLPNSQENNHKAEKSPVQGTSEKPADPEPSDDSTEDKSEDESDDTTKKESEESESEMTEDSTEEAGKENSKNDDSENDKRDEIETTSP